MHYNRRERRRLAKQLGLLSTKNENQAQAAERRKRSREAGDQIHRQFLAENEVRLREAHADREARMLENLTAAYGSDRAKEIMANNLAHDRARQEKRSKSRQATLTLAKESIEKQNAAKAAEQVKAGERRKRAAARKRQEESEKRDRIKIMRAGKRR